MSRRRRRSARTKPRELNSRIDRDERIHIRSLIYAWVCDIATTEVFCPHAAVQHRIHADGSRAETYTVRGEEWERERERERKTAQPEYEFLRIELCAGGRVYRGYTGRDANAGLVPHTRRLAARAREHSCARLAKTPEPIGTGAPLPSYYIIRSPRLSYPASERI